MMASRSIAVMRSSIPARACAGCVQLRGVNERAMRQHAVNHLYTPKAGPACSEPRSSRRKRQRPQHVELGKWHPRWGGHEACSLNHRLGNRMRITKAWCLRVAVLVGGMVSAGPVYATPITWNLSGIVLTDGTNVTGSFVFDADTTTFSGLNMTTSGGTSVPATSSWFFNLILPGG